jgi:hypothetical protein
MDDEKTPAALDATVQDFKAARQHPFHVVRIFINRKLPSLRVFEKITNGNSGDRFPRNDK